LTGVGPSTHGNNAGLESSLIKSRKNLVAAQNRHPTYPNSFGQGGINETHRAIYATAFHRVKDHPGMSSSSDEKQSLHKETPK
jgi:hypothetical protein